MLLAAANPEGIRKISSEAMRKEASHCHLIPSLCIIRDEIQKSELGRFTVPGYIQHICAVPFSVLLYTEQDVRCKDISSHAWVKHLLSFVILLAELHP